MKGSTWYAMRRKEQARRGKSVLVVAVDSRDGNFRHADADEL